MTKARGAHSKDRDRKLVTFSLWRVTVEQLEELCQILGTTPEQIVESLVHQRYSERHRELFEDCPWKITERAIEGARAELRRSGRPNDRDAAIEVITAAAIDSLAAHREHRRAPSEQPDGALRYRGPKPLRLSLLVRDNAIVGASRFDRGQR